MNSMNDSDIFRISNPIWEAMSSASNNGDYEKFITNFSIDLASLITKDRFQKQAQEFPLLTTLKENAIPIGCIRRASGTTIIYRQLSTKLEGEFIGQLTLLKDENTYEVINAQVY